MGDKVQMFSFCIFIFAACLLVQLFVNRYNARKSRYPPGPRPLPFIGNLLDMPTEQEWITFADWGKKWGDLTMASVLNQRILVLNSAASALALLDKQSSTSSDRPSIPMVNMVGWNRSLALAPYGSKGFRVARKAFHNVMGTPAALERSSRPETSEAPTEGPFSICEEEGQRFMKLLGRSPERFVAHIRTYAGGVILRMSHGYRVEDENDSYIISADVATDQFSNCIAPGAFLVNLVPALQHLPEWMPGGGFKKTVRAWNKKMNEVIDGPHEFARKQIDEGVAQPSMSTELLRDAKLCLGSERELAIKWATASAYLAGADTTVAAIHAFFKAMAMYPRVQRQAQEELDRVIGANKLPLYSDRERLPYLNALTLEALRWHSVAPSGLPHLVSEDMFYDGYLIPKGTMIIANIWGICHDHKIYKDPFTFNPSRFISTPQCEAEQDPRAFAFGFGRRICPGRVLGESSLFLACAMTLATFDISPATDEKGEALQLDINQTTGTISHPVPFKCTVRPRSGV